MVTAQDSSSRVGKKCRVKSLKSWGSRFAAKTLGTEDKGGSLRLERRQIFHRQLLQSLRNPFFDGRFRPYHQRRDVQLIGKLDMLVQIALGPEGIPLEIDVDIPLNRSDGYLARSGHFFSHPFKALEAINH